jgi:glycosyltransferase involved in cell wall biosynthesis
MTRPLALAIQTATPDRREAYAWGDHHFAGALAKAIQALGHYARVDCRSEALRARYHDFDAVLNLRGLARYPTDRAHLNLLWLISHPHNVSPRELDAYDHVFVASHAHARRLAQQTSASVSSLSQATDPELLASAAARAVDVPAWPVLFVGNSRKVYRPIVRDCLRAGIDVAVYGSLWEGMIPARCIKGSHVPNEQVGAYYRACGILLNDHWKDMREEGFISNRLYDAAACGAFVLTDPVDGLETEFPGSYDTVDGPAELAAKIRFYLEHPEERARRAALAREQVLASHTFAHRAAEIVDKVQSLMPRLEHRREFTAQPRLARPLLDQASLQPGARS